MLPAGASMHHRSDSEATPMRPLQSTVVGKVAGSLRFLRAAVNQLQPDRVLMIPFSNLPGQSVTYVSGS
jgi:hypothetical protein